GSKHRQHQIRSRFPAPFGESLTKTGIAPRDTPLRREIEKAANAEHCVTNTALCFLAHPRPLSLQHIIEEFARKGQVLAHIPNPRSDRLEHHATVGLGGGSHHPSPKSLVEPPHSTIKRFDRIVEPSRQYDYGPCWIVRWCNGLRRKGRCEQQSCDYWRHHPVVESSTARRTIVIPARQASSWTISEIFIHNASLMLRTKHPQTKNLEFFRKLGDGPG